MNELIRTAAATIHFFTGNNIGPKGDLASRNLTIRLEIDRADPARAAGLVRIPCTPPLLPRDIGSTKPRAGHPAVQ